MRTSIIDSNKGRVSMRLISSSSIPTDIPLLILASLVLLAQPSRNAMAEDLLGLYVGAAAGQSRVEATAPDAPDFHENHSAFKAMVGIRPMSLLGAEVAYNDLGHPSRQSGIEIADVEMKGESVFGVLYLPVPIVDVFVKVGLARIDSTASTNIVCIANVCAEALVATPKPERRTNVGFAGGAGVQFKMGSLAVRGEYERFNAAGGNPSLLTVGITWTFF
jgi:opacity protein-like surface antigen